MEFIQVTAENLEREHICCAIASGRDCQVLSKKSWLARSEEHTSELQSGPDVLEGGCPGEVLYRIYPRGKCLGSGGGGGADVD